MHRSTPWTRLAASSLTALGLLAGGCGTDSGDEERSERAEAPAADETVFDDMLETQDRARAVEDLNDERREQLESAIEPGEDVPPSDEHDSR